MVDDADAEGVVCHDEAEHGEICWWINVLQRYVLSVLGESFAKDPTGFIQTRLVTRVNTWERAK